MSVTALNVQRQAQKLGKMVEAAKHQQDLLVKYLVLELRPEVRKIELECTSRFEAFRFVLEEIDRRWWRRLWRFVSRRPGIAARYDAKMVEREQFHREALKIATRKLAEAAEAEEESAAGEERQDGEAAQRTTA